jgi:hypothetical protein
MGRSGAGFSLRILFPFDRKQPQAEACATHAIVFQSFRFPVLLFLRA